MSSTKLSTRIWMQLPLRQLKAFKIYNGLAYLNNLWKREDKVIVYEEKPKLHEAIALKYRDKPILYLEFGVFEGWSFKFHLEHNKHPDSLFYGFDSFEGLPEKWETVKVNMEKGHFTTHGKVPETNDSRAHFVVGVFQAVLTDWLEKNAALFDGRQIVIHMDADLFTSDLFVLTQLYRHIYGGTQIIFDDFMVINHDSEAFELWTKSHLINYSYVARSANFQCVWVEIVEKRKHYL